MSQFYPRPEAQATTWDDLMHPVKIAVGDLLIRIHGAHGSVRSKNADKSKSFIQTGNCFLVYGSRGTGKTTVLLNAKKAVCRKEGDGFFAETKDSKDNETPDETKKQKAKEHAESLRKDGIIWLDILNLEPIPSEANLLTILLTQVRKALYSHCDKRQREQRSIYEEEANSAQQLLHNLINDTTLMWQNIVEPDTRNISARQVKAADIYANFPEKFKTAMDKLIEELSDVRGFDSKISIVLPIDNIDRSTEHLQSIVKLAQLVSHPNLWLVMAGDRVEVETFLERAYWKELIRSSDGAGARGKTDSDGEDEALSMARRQANATAQKLWPANHRVEINFLMPEKTLDFIYNKNSSFSANTDITLDIKTPCVEYKAHLEFRCQCYLGVSERRTIRNLLEKIKIPTTQGQRVEPSNCNINLFNLFYVEDKVTEIGKVIDKVSPQYLTRAGHHGLSLPARSVLDLWQLLDWLVHDASLGEDFKAEKIVRTLLRTAISSSDMLSGMAQDLQTYILRRGEKSGTILYFQDKVSLNVIPMTSTNNDFEHTLRPVFPKINDHLRSLLKIKNIEDIVLELRFDLPIKSFDASKRQHPQPFLTENARDNENRRTELPLLVGAWVMVLYDILALAEAEASSYVIGGAKLDDNYPNVTVNHSVIQAGKYRNIKPIKWLPPAWGLFWGRNIFSLRWQNFRKEILKANLQDGDSVTRLLAAGWILCVLKTSIELIASIDETVNSKLPDNKLKKIKDITVIKDGRINVNVFEKKVMLAAGCFYILIQEVKKYQLEQELKENKKDKVISAAYDIMLATGRWLETEFIYFLSYAYVPIKSDVSKKRFDTIWKTLGYKKDENDTLTTHWAKNAAFILATIEEKFPEPEDADNSNIEITKTTTTETNGTTPIVTIKESTRVTKKIIYPIGKLLFTDLYDKLESPTSAGNL